jgi:hypothetical protein
MEVDGAARCSPWWPSDGKELDDGGKLEGDGVKSFPRALAAAQTRGAHEAAAKQSHQRLVAWRRALTGGRWTAVPRSIVEAEEDGAELRKLGQKDK